MEIEDLCRTPTEQQLCFLAPYGECLRLLGADVDETLLFIAASGPRFSFSYIHEGCRTPHPVSSADWVSIEGALPVVLSALSTFGLQIDVVPSPSLTILVEHLKEAQGYMIVYVDVFHLPYHPFHHRFHGQTSLVLLGLGDGGVRFVDPYVKSLRVERIEGEIGLPDLARALDGQEIFEQRMEICSAVPRAAFTPEHRLEAYVQDFLAADGALLGPSGMRALADHMPTWHEVWCDDGLGQPLRMAYHHISDRGGPSKTRAALGSFLLAWPTGIPSAERLAQGFSTASVAWRALAATFFRGSVTPGPDQVRRARSKLLEIVELEHRLFSELGEQVCDGPSVG